MKKLVAAIMIICILPACSFALDLTAFNANAYVCGEKEMLDETTGKQADPYIVFQANGCLIGFQEENDKITQIVVQGDGSHFLAYAMAAILVFADDYKSFNENAGTLLSCFLLARSGEKGQALYTTTGQAIYIQPHNDEYFFTIGQ